MRSVITHTCTPTFRRLRQEGPPRKSEATLGYVVRPSLKKEKKRVLKIPKGAEHLLLFAGLLTAAA